MVREGSYLGCHTVIVSNSIICSMGLFVFSEIIFFSRFFGALFYNVYGSDFVCMKGRVIGLDPLGIPLVNTVLLLSSGVVATWVHINIVNGLDVRCRI